jgi:hypothetical protein
MCEHTHPWQLPRMDFCAALFNLGVLKLKVHTGSYWGWEELSPWTKSNAPGPSLWYQTGRRQPTNSELWNEWTDVVPPANEYPDIKNLNSVFFPIRNIRRRELLTKSSRTRRYLSSISQDKRMPTPMKRGHKSMLVSKAERDVWSKVIYIFM